MTVTHHHTQIDYLHVPTSTSTHMHTITLNQCALLRAVKSKDFPPLNCSYPHHQEWLFPNICFVYCRFSFQLISVTLLINEGVVIPVPGRNQHSVFFSCMENIGSSWVMFPDGRPHVCWLKGNGRGMLPAMPRQPGEATAEHIMPAWMRGPWHQV